jgi:phenylacetate-CoA ligase
MFLSAPKPEETENMSTRAPRESELEPIERVGRNELAALQLERLKWSLGHAYKNSPMYRRKFDDAGARVDDLRSLEDLAKFPFTAKQDLRDHYPFGAFATPMEQVVRLHASSGTTGKATVVGYTKNDIDTWALVMERSLRAAGVHAGDIVHVGYGYGLFTGGLGAHYGVERLGATVVPMSGGQTERQVQLILDFKPDVIMVTPSYCLNIADELERQGIDPRDSSIRVGLFGAEPWTNSMRRELEERFGMDALDLYGISEVIGPGVAQECIETKDGMTLWEDHFYPEIINPDTGGVLEEGEPGELVLTSLTKEAMPMVRYRTRDLTRLLPPTARTMRRMDRVTGRSDDMMIIRGVNVFPSQIEAQILKHEELGPHYQLELSRERHLVSLSISVEVKPDKDGLDEPARDRVAKALAHNIKSHIGITTAILVHDVGGVPRSEGKAQRVIDKRPKE